MFSCFHFPINVYLMPSSAPPLASPRPTPLARDNVCGIVL